MNSSAVANIALTVLLIGWILLRQLADRPVNARRLFLLPVIFAVIGLYLLSRSGHLTGTAVDYLAADLAVAVVLGLIRGWTVRLHEQHGYLWRKGTWLTMLLWAVSIAARVSIGVLAARHGADVVAKDGIMLSFGVSLASQGLIIYGRGQQSGIPFAPDDRSQRRRI